MENLLLRYSNPQSPDEYRSDVDVKLPGPFELEGREWFAGPPGDDGFRVCTEHVRIFKVLLDGVTHTYTGPRPEDGEVVTLDGAGPRVRVSGVALAHHDVRRGSFHAVRIDDARSLTTAKRSSGANRTEENRAAPGY
jgi:hypothetical protein